MSSFLPTTEPVTISLDQFRTSLLSSWIVFLENDPSISSVHFPPDNRTLKVVPNMPIDREEDYDVPSFVITIIDEDIVAGRVGNFFTNIYTEKEGDEVQMPIYSQRFMCTYQIDIIARDLSDQGKLMGYLDKKLLGPEVIGQWGEVRPGMRNVGIESFYVRDFSKRTSLQQDPLTVPETDVRVYWRSPGNVQVQRIPSFGNEFSQVSYTVEFWSDLWYTEYDQVITNISVQETVLPEAEV